MRHYLPPGELTEADERTLWTLAKDKKCCVDLGTFLGRSAVLLSLRAKKVLTIDLFEHCPREAESSPGHGYRGMAAKHNLRAGAVRKWLSLYSNIDVAQVDTGSAELAADGSVDLVFIDDDHSYQGVAWDFWAWLPKLKRGGIVAFHDVNDWHPPVQKFVKRLEKERLDMIALPLGDTPSSIRAFRKASA
jgi:predicted O-methyltransferase YrrM